MPVITEETSKVLCQTSFWGREKAESFSHFSLLKNPTIPWFCQKHDFRSIQQNIPQISDFAENWDSNPHPMGILRRTLQKCLQKFFCKNWISGQKT
jgi:hypothetical protein